MAIETPPTIDGLPPVPDDTIYTTGDEFVPVADDYLGALPDFGDQIEAVAGNVYNNALEAEGFATTASAAANAADNAQTVAEGFRDEAEIFKNETATIASSIPDGTINDTITTLTDTWSSSKISSEIASAGAVDSVNGQTGVVVLDKSDVGLSNVDNTSDANKLINASNLNAGTVPSARLPNATATEVGALKVRLNGTEAFFTNDGNDA